MRNIADILADLAIATNGTEQTRDLLTEVREWSALLRTVLNETRSHHNKVVRAYEADRKKMAAHNDELQTDIAAMRAAIVRLHGPQLASAIDAELATLKAKP